MTIEEAL